LLRSLLSISNTSDSLFLSSYPFQFISLIFLSSLIPSWTFLGLLLGLDDSNVTAPDAGATTCGASAGIITNSITRTSQQQLALSIITLPFPTAAAAGGGGEYSYPFVRIIITTITPVIITPISQQQQQQQAVSIITLPFPAAAAGDGGSAGD
jgi:uncharacterized membrane protein